MLAIERADERVALEEDRRIPHRRPVVLAGRDRAVQHLGRIEGQGKLGLASRMAVDVLGVERPEVGKLDAAPRPPEPVIVGWHKLESLTRRRARRTSVGRASPRRPGASVPGPRPRRSSFPPDPGRKAREPRRSRRRRGLAAPRTVEVDDRFLFVQRSFLGGEVETERITTPSSRCVRPSPAGGSVGNAARPSGRILGSTASSTCVTRTGSPGVTISTSAPSTSIWSGKRSAEKDASSQAIRPPILQLGSKAPQLRRARRNTSCAAGGARRSPGGFVLGRPRIESRYEGSLRPSLGTTVSSRRRARFRQTLLGTHALILRVVERSAAISAGTARRDLDLDLPRPPKTPRGGSRARRCARR